MFLLSTLIACALAANSYVGIGDRLVRGAGVESALPITAASAKAAGWNAVNATACAPGVGIVFYKTSSGQFSADEPVGLGFTPFGQLASITVTMDGQAAPQLISKGWWVKASASASPSLTISLRSDADACSTVALPAAVGDRVQVNREKLNWTVPLTTPDKAQYHQGSCIKKMGVHWLHDITKPGAMSWVHGNLAPVVPMFDPFTGEINAVFVTAPDVQQRLTSRRGWDLVPLTSHLMCANLCDQTCEFDELFLSTMHLFFKDPKTLRCQLPCGKIKCCADSDKSWFREEFDEEAAQTTAAQSTSGVAGVSASLVAVAAASMVACK